MFNVTFNTKTHLKIVHRKQTMMMVVPYFINPIWDGVENIR